MFCCYAERTIYLPFIGVIVSAEAFFLQFLDLLVCAVCLWVAACVRVLLQSNVYYTLLKFINTAANALKAVFCKPLVFNIRPIWWMRPPDTCLLGVTM